MTEAKMDAALKAKWVEALRSGKYQQCKKTLQTDDGFCCLGVLAQVGGKTIGEDVYDRHLDGYRWFDQVMPGHDYSKLTDMNDSGKPFSVIADYIEQNL